MEYGKIIYIIDEIIASPVISWADVYYEYSIISAGTKEPYPTTVKSEDDLKVGALVVFKDNGALVEKL
jgi:hypothetical protein